jgi:hypothetical protein
MRRAFAMQAPVVLVPYRLETAEALFESATAQMPG